MLEMTNLLHVEGEMVLYWKKETCISVLQLRKYKESSMDRL